MIKYFIDGIPHFIDTGDNKSEGSIEHGHMSSMTANYSYKAFKKLLDTRNITPYRVSRDTGIWQTTLSDWKNGRSKPKVDKLLTLAEYFGVTVDYFLKGETHE